MSQPNRTRLNTVNPHGDAARGDDNGLFRVDSESDLDTGSAIASRIRRNRHPLSGILVSFIAHTGLLIALALIVYTTRPVELISVMASISDEADDVPKQFEDDAATIEIFAPDEAEAQIEMNETELATDDELLTPDAEDSQFQMPSEVTSPAQVTELAPVTNAQNLPTGGGLEGRNNAARARLAADRGGSEASEAAVERGLRWIVAHQQPDGSWHLNHNKGECNGRCKNPGTRESTTAATGLSLLALLGAGYTHQTGPYQDEVRSGLLYLADSMRISTHGGSLAESSMYDHAIATLALSEAMIMTGDSSLHETVSLAMKYIVSAQHPAGGWRYVPGEPGDITVTGWQVMALKSCRRAGIDPPEETMKKAEAFIDSLSESDSSYYGYQKPETLPVPTAVGLLSRMYLGWSRDRHQLDVGPDYLADLAPSKHDVYFNYYATQVLFHVRHERWPVWNERMRDYLVKTQETDGHQDGSWFFDDPHGSVGGRLYATAMCIMTLEVYYRYLPLYDSDSLN